MKNIPYKMKNVASYTLIGLLLFILQTNASSILRQFSSPKTIGNIVVQNDYLWCATSGGAFRYSLSSGEKKLYLDQASLPDPILTDVVKDDAGNLWFGSKSGYLTCLQPTSGTFTTYNACASSGWSINCLRFFKNYIFIGTSNGLSIFSIAKGNTQNVQQIDTFALSQISSIRNYGDTLVFLAPNCLASTVIKDIKTTIFSNPKIWNILPINNAHGFFMENGNIKADTSFYVSQSGNNLWQFWYNSYVHSYNNLYHNHALSMQNISSPVMCVISIDSNTWAIGTMASCFYLYNIQKDTMIQVSIQGPSDSEIRSVALDRAANLWYVANDMTNGVGTFNGTVWSNYTNSNTPGIGPTSAGALESRNTITVTKKNDVWVSTFFAGVKWFNSQESNWYSYEDSSSPTNTLVSPMAHFPDGYWCLTSGICEDSSGYIWIANFQAYNGNILHVRKPRESVWRSFSKSDNNLGFPSDFTGPLAANKSKSGDNYIYFGFYTKEDLTGGGFVVLSYPSSKSPVDPTTQLVSSSVKSNVIPINGIAVANDTLVWLSSSNGIYKMVNNDITTITKIDSITSSDPFYTVSVGYNGWPLFCKDRDLYTYDPETKSRKNLTNSGKLGSEVNSIVLDAKKSVYWIGTKKGLFRFESGDSTKAILAKTIDVYPNPISRRYFSLWFAGFQPDSPASIFIYDVAGMLITKISETKKTGLINWNGKTQNGSIIVPGVYFYQAVAKGGKKCTGKIMVVP